MDLKKGNPRRLLDDFSDARNPIWSSDGRALLFEGCPSVDTPLATCEEWWTVRADGSDFRSTGGLAQLEKDSVEPQSPPEAWLGDMVVFSARHNDQITLWELNISRKDSRVYGNAHQITTSGTQERAASLATNGTIAFGRVASGLHIWQVPLGASSPSRGPSKATDDLGSDGCPSSTRDGRWLFFSRRLGNERNIVAKDLSSGRESVLVAAAQQDAFWPVSNATGSRVAYELRKKARSSIGVISPGAQPRTLCTNCAHPSSWFGDKGVLYSNPEGAIAIVSATTGSSRIVVPSEENISLGDADWSPTHEYLLFTRTRRGGGNQLMVVRLSLGTEQVQGRPVSILDTIGRADRPRWSHDGRTVYYLSKQDGFMCIWGQPFDPNLGVATGVPYPVIHYHNPRTTPDRTSLAVLGLAVTRDSVFVSSGEVTESVWTGMLNTPGLFENLRRFLSSGLAQ
jgi:Tol biopolymer transport system component